MKQFWCISKLVVGRLSLWNWLLKLILTENIFKIASKPTSIVTIFANIALAGNRIFQYLLNTCAYYQNSYKYCHNICKYWVSEYTLSISLNNTYDFRCGNCFYMRVSFFVTFANMFGKWIEFLFDFSAWQWGMYAKIKSCKR